MEWKYVKPLGAESDIHDFERSVRYFLPDDFIACVKQNNGGRPAKKVFDTEKTKERALKSFLSFNRDDRETVWKVQEWDRAELANKYVAFAIDNFGDLICFDKADDSVVFLDLETSAVERVADTFSDFLGMLRE